MKADQTALADAPATTATNGETPPAPVKLASPHDFSLTTQALEHRAEELKKLSKKNSEEGYTREARAIDADVAAIEYSILPQFRAQRELPLATAEVLKKEVEGALRVFVFRAFDGLDDPKANLTAQAIRGRRERLLETLIERVTSFATDVADEAYNHGHAVRQATPQAIAAKSIGSLRVQ